MAKTGLFVKGVNVSRMTIQWPFQQIKIIKMNPINYPFLGENMSKELVPFSLPLTFTISPVHPEKNLSGFISYATRFGDMDNNCVKNIIAGIVHGETRAFVGSLTINEIFSDRDKFRTLVVDKVQEDLNQFGLEIHNANIEEMKDTEGNCYFENLKKKALEEALTQSRIAVAEARKEGNIGEKHREVITRKEQSTLEADATQTETNQKQKISNYDRELNIVIINNKQQEELAKIEAHKMTEQRRIDIEAELNVQKQREELERLRSSSVIKATADSEAVIKLAEAEKIAMQLKADGILYQETKKAEGIQKNLEATAEGLSRIYEISKTNPELANFYMALERGVFDREGLFSVLAGKQADAIKGLEPKINVWSTGPKGDNQFADVVSGLVKTFPPILDAIQQQTQIQLPSFAKHSQS